MLQGRQYLRIEYKKKQSTDFTDDTEKNP